MLIPLLTKEELEYACPDGKTAIHWAGEYLYMCVCVCLYVGVCVSICRCMYVHRYAYTFLSKEELEYACPDGKTAIHWAGMCVCECV